MHKRDAAIEQWIRLFDPSMRYPVTLILRPPDGTQTPPLEKLLTLWAARRVWSVVQLALSPQHNDLVSFIDDLGAKVGEVIDLEPASVSHGDGPVALLNALLDSLQELAIVLHGYDAITDFAVHDTMTWMLDYLPPTTHMLIVSTSPPPLPNLPRLRVRRQLYEISLSSPPPQTLTRHRDT